jgi:hypothetical protein
MLGDDSAPIAPSPVYTTDHHLVGPRTSRARGSRGCEICANPCQRALPGRIIGV